MKCLIFVFFLFSSLSAVAGNQGCDGNLIGTSSNNKLAIVADDSVAIRTIVTITLKSNGFTVLEAENGREALDLFHCTPGVMLLVTDNHMPVMHGTELTKLLFGKVAIVMMSGEKIELPARMDGVPRVDKPFTIRVLLDAVAIALASQKIN
jgi:CheY-like chemotaxis protein